MIDIPDSIKQLLKRDSVRKNLRIHFPNGEHKDINNDQIIQESAKFTESICSRDSLKFGLCERSTFECDLYGIEDIKGSTIEPEIEIDVSSLATYADDIFPLLNRKYFDEPWNEFNDPNNKDIDLRFWYTYQDVDSAFPTPFHISNEMNYIYNPYTKTLYSLEYGREFERDGQIRYGVRWGDPVTINREDEPDEYKHPDIDVKHTYHSYDHPNIPYRYDDLEPGVILNARVYNAIKDKFTLSEIKTELEYGFGILPESKYESTDPYVKKVNDKNQLLYTRYNAVVFTSMYDEDHDLHTKMFIAYGSVMKCKIYNSSGTYNYDNKYTYKVDYKFLGEIQDYGTPAYNYFNYKKKYYDRIAHVVEGISGYNTSTNTLYDLNASTPTKTKTEIIEHKYVDNPGDDEYWIEFNKLCNKIIEEKASFICFRDYGISELHRTNTDPWPAIFEGDGYVLYENTNTVSKVHYLIQPKSGTEFTDKYEMIFTATYIGVYQEGGHNYNQVLNELYPYRKMYVYPEGSMTSNDLDFPYFPIKYGRFKIEESSLDDTKKQRKIVAYTPPIVAEKLTHAELTKLKWAERVNSAYIPNVIGFVCSQSYIDPEDFIEFEDYRPIPLDFTNLKNVSYRSFHISMNKSTNHLWSDMKTEAYRGSAKGKPTLYRMPWIGALTNKTDSSKVIHVYLKSITFDVRTKGARVNESNLNMTRNFIHRIKTEPRALTGPLYKILDDEDMDDIYYIGQKIETPIYNVKGYSDYGVTSYDRDYEDKIRKIVFTRIFKHCVGSWGNTEKDENDEIDRMFTRDGYYPKVNVTYQKGTSTIKSTDSYDAKYSSVYLFGNGRMNEKTWEELKTPDVKNNTKKAEILIPSQMEVYLRRMSFSYVMYDDNGKIVFWKNYYVDPVEEIGDLLFKIEADTSEYRLDEFHLTGDNAKFVKKFDLPEKDETEETEETIERVDYREEIDPVDYANDMFEIFGRFGYWDRTLSMYRSKYIRADDLSDYNIPDFENYLEDFDYENPASSELELPMSIDHHFRKEEYSTLTLGDDVKPINQVLYVNHREVEEKEEENTSTNTGGQTGTGTGTNTDTGTGSSSTTTKTQIESFDCKYPETITGLDYEYIALNNYDLKDNIYFDKLIKQSAEKDPALNLAKAVYNRIKGIGYKQVTIDAVGRPYLESGDIISFEAVEQHQYNKNNGLYPHRNFTSNTFSQSSEDEEEEIIDEDEVLIESVGYTSIVLRRTLSGIQHLRDSIESK